MYRCILCELYERVYFTSTVGICAGQVVYMAKNETMTTKMVSAERLA